MPLVLITGYPGSGKTTRTTDIVTRLRERLAPERKIHVVSDDLLDIPKDVYKDAKSEKMARASIMSAVKRHLSKQDIVVVDALNYIKGFRYQLFCEAKAEQTTFAVVHVGAPADKCKEWNKTRDDPWSEDLLDALIFRYEEPNGMNRWDSPLYTIPYTDKTINDHGEFDQLYDSIINSKVKPPNFATVLKPAVATDYVYELEKQTQEIVLIIVERHEFADIINIGNNIVLKLPVESVGIGQLQRLRRNFVALNKVRQIDRDRVKGAFVEFLNRSFGTS
ncbi:chromatin associated protein KTI12 [Lipomyces japonicus]|uniref:chromatin associated protein KTI12 n=1 Tax=Lipomyces japonicus TaxID=56871 RepID=UPI0034CE72C4